MYFQYITERHVFQPTANVKAHNREEVGFLSLNYKQQVDYRRADTNTGHQQSKGEIALNALGGLGNGYCRVGHQLGIALALSFPSYDFYVYIIP